MSFLLQLPDEILVHLLTYAEDTDLQSLAITCKRLRGFTMDGPLRRHILLIRTPARLSSSLSLRPSRDLLAKKNILRGVHIHQHIRQGQYIGGDSSVRSYHVSCRLERQMLSLRIARKLKTRPDWNELVERGVIPEEMFMKEEEFEARRQWMHYNQQRQGMIEGGVDVVSETSVSTQSSTIRLSDQQWQVRHGEYTHPFDTVVVDSDKDHEMAEPNQPSPAPLAPPAPSSNTHSAAHHQLHPSSSTTPTPPRRHRKSISMVLIPKIELLRRAMDRDRLSRLVQKRPSPTELNQSPGTATVLHAYHLIAYKTTSPELVPLAAQLSFLLKGERLGHWLAHRRPSLQAMLNERHLLKTEVRTAWMLCPGVSPKVRFYEGLIQERRHYDDLQHNLQQLVSTAS